MKIKLLLTLSMTILFTLGLLAQTNPEIELHPQGIEFTSQQGQSFRMERDSNSLMIGNDSMPNMLRLKYMGPDSALIQFLGSLDLQGELVLTDSNAMLVLADDRTGIAPLDTTRSGIVPLPGQGMAFATRDTARFFVDSLGPVAAGITFIKRGNVIVNLNSGRSHDNMGVAMDPVDLSLDFSFGDTLLASLDTMGGMHASSFTVADSNRMLVLADDRTGIAPLDTTRSGIVPLPGQGMAFATRDTARFFLDSIGPVVAGRAGITFVERTGVSGKDFNSGRSDLDNIIGTLPESEGGDLFFGQVDSMGQTMAIFVRIAEDSSVVVSKDLYAIGDVRGGTIHAIENLQLDDDGTPANILGLGSIGLHPSSDWGFTLSADAGNTLTLGSDGALFLSAACPTELKDADNDTKIQVEESPDEDLIRFDVAGTERMRLDSNTLHLFPLGFGNTFVGANAGKDNDPTAVITANYNSAFGSDAFQANTAGGSNVAVGNASLYSNTFGDNNVAVGRDAMYSNTDGDENTAIGRNALYSNLVGEYNVAVGYRALYSTNHNFNTAVGERALENSFGGTGNTAVGYRALQTLTSGFGNTAIGEEADVTQNNLTNATAIGYRAKVASNNSLVLGATGPDAIKVGIGTQSPDEELHVVGDICYTGGIGACSDRRYKHHFRPIEGALQKLTQLNGLYYQWRRDDFPEQQFAEGRQIGVIAQEVEALFPEIVMTNPEGYKSVDYSRLTPVLLEAVKELAEESEQQQSEIEDLRQQNEALQRQLDEVAELRSMVLEMRAEMEGGGKLDTED